MTRLSDGVFCVLLPDGTAALRGACAPVDVGASQRASALALARGAPERPAGVEGWPVVDAPPLDEHALARLASLGAGFAWQVEGEGEGARLTDELRQLAARARAFGRLDALPLLPESAAGIALRLDESMPAGGEVLVHGGHLLVGAALALLGRRVTLWSCDEAQLDLARAGGLGLAAHEGDVLAALAPELCGRFSLVLVDALAAEGAVVALLARATAALAADEGARIGLLAHPMQRELTRQMISTASLVAHDGLYEAAVRLLPGFAAAEFSFDLHLAAPRGAPVVDAARPLTAREAKDLDATEQAHGCVELHGVVPAELTGARLDRALAHFAAYAGAPLCAGGHDDDDALMRYLALEGGGHAALSAERESGVVAVDLYPWTPSLLAALVSALLVELPRRSEELPLGR